MEYNLYDTKQGLKLGQPKLREIITNKERKNTFSMVSFHVRKETYSKLHSAK